MMALENTSILQSSVSDIYNSSFWNDTDSETSPYAHGERVILGVIVFIISITGFVGNAIVLIAVALSRRLQTVTNVFVVNLSVADLTMSIWASINASIGLAGGLPPSLNTLCQTVAFTNPSLAGVILFSLAAIAVNRMLLITKPSAVYRNIYTARKLALNVVIIWLVPFMVTSILVAADVGRLSYNTQVHLCLDDSEHKYSVLFKSLLAATLYPGPAMITIISYGTIYNFIRRHFKKEQLARSNLPKRSCTPNAGSQSQDTSTVDLGVNTTIDNTRKNRINKNQIQITKNLFIVSCLCFLLPLPNSIFLILGLDRLFLYGVVFFFATSAVNPLLYGAKHPMFREVMLCILHRQWSDIPEPSRILKALRLRRSEI